MIKAILFDADGVLINGKKFSTQFDEDYGISRATTQPFFTGIFNKCLVGNADLKEVIKPYLLEWGWKKPVEEFLEYWFKTEHNIDEDLVAYVQILRKKGIKCCVATNQEQYRAEYLLNKMGFAASFDKVFASAHLGHKKPDLGFYSKVLENLRNIKKEEIFFWDDTQEHIDAAKKIGIHAEIYTTFEDFKNKIQSYLL